MESCHDSAAQTPQTGGAAAKRPAVTVGAVLVVLALAAMLVVSVLLNFGVHEQQQFTFLARSFMHGDLAFNDPAMATIADTTPFRGRYYWPLGPLPAVVLIPFELVAAALGGLFYQGYLQPVLVVALLVVVFRIARRAGYRTEDSLYWAFGFAFATTFLGVALWSWSWYFSQVLTCLILFLAIAEMSAKRRPLVIGILFGLALATRVTAALGIVWCAGELLCSRVPLKDKLRSLIVMGLPCLAALALLLCYNYARFGNPFEQGYAAQIIPPNAAAARAIGLFSWQHLPGNLYYLLLAGPTPVEANSSSTAMLAFPYVGANPWGMSIFLTSPCLLYLFWLRHRDATSRLLLVTTLVIALPLVFYYGIGYRQFGYRYALDFAPFLYFLLLRNFRLQRGDLTPGMKALFIGSALFNLYLFAGHFLWQVT